MKKFSIHFDALVVLFLVFMTSLGFNLFQRYQYSDLLQEHIRLQIDAQVTDFNLGFMKVDLKKCNDALAKLEQ